MKFIPYFYYIIQINYSQYKIRQEVEKNADKSESNQGKEPYFPE